MVRSDQSLGRLTRDVLNLLLPSACAVCRRAEGPLCDACRPLVAVSQRRVRGMECWSGAELDSGASAIMAAFKEYGVTRLARELALLVRPALERFSADAGVTYVPIPTRASADRARGYRPVELVLRRSHVPFRRLLRVRGGIHDQRALSQLQRAENAQHAFVARRAASGIERVILVDDVVTTGATLASAAAVLEAVGVHVVGMVTAFSTPRRTSHKPQRNFPRVGGDSLVSGDYGEGNKGDKVRP